MLCNSFLTEVSRVVCGQPRRAALSTSFIQFFASYSETYKQVFFTLKPFIFILLPATSC